MKFQEKEIVQKAEEQLRKTLERVPFIEVGSTRFEQPKEQAILFQPDLLMQISSPDGPVTLVVEVKSALTPKAAREASRQLASLAAMIPAGYGVLVAPYISERSAEVCREAKVGYMDLAGNYGLYFERVFLELQGRPNPFKKEQGIKSLFSPKSSRAVRVMLENPERIWKTQTLAQEASLSTGMISNIKSRLEEQELVRKEPGGFRLIEPETLLMEWSKKYTVRKNKWSDYYLPDDIPAIENKIANSLKILKQQYAFTLFSAAGKVAPYARYQRVFVYVDGDQSRLVEELGLKRVDSGPNLTILGPYDEGVFYGEIEVQGQLIVGLVQLYLDLVSYKGRGEDAASFLLESLLRKTWQKNM